MNLEQIKARLDAATEGASYCVVNDLIGGFDVANVDKPVSQIDPDQGEFTTAWGLSEADATFFAHAPTDIAELVAEVERLSLENELLSDAHPYVDVQLSTLVKVVLPVDDWVELAFALGIAHSDYQAGLVGTRTESDRLRLIEIIKALSDQVNEAL